MKQQIRVTLISNAGVLLEFNGRKILIDGLYHSGVPYFGNAPSEMKQKIVQGAPPFDNIELLLFTHDHSDHFEAASTAEFMRNHKDACLVSTEDVIKKIPADLRQTGGQRLIKLNPGLGCTESIRVKGIDLEAISLKHTGREFEDVKNLGFVITSDGKTILHVGDAGQTKENYGPLNLARKNIDLLLVPFPYISTLTGRQVIEKYIRPETIGVIHLPARESDGEGWREAAKKSYFKVKDSFAETFFLEEAGQSIDIAEL